MTNKNQMAIEWIKKNTTGKENRKTKAQLLKKCQKQVDIAITGAREAWRKIYDDNDTTKSTKLSSKCSISRTDFFNNFDPHAKIRYKIRKALPKIGDDDIIKDSDFRLRWCNGAPSNGWRIVANEPEFFHNQFIKSDITFWCTKTTKKWAIDNVTGVRELPTNI